MSVVGVVEIVGEKMQVEERGEGKNERDNIHA